MAKLRCKRTLVEILAGDLDRARTSLRTAEANADELESRPDSELSALLRRCQAGLAEPAKKS